ncbi:MAG: hypothetical protein ABIN55_12050 [Aeromicrobium sp.]
MTAPATFAVMRPGGGAIRLVRSSAVALVCTATAAFAHLSAGGSIPASAITILLAAATAVAWLVAGRRVTPGQLVGLLVLCQVCVHLGCSVDSMNMSVAMFATHVAATAISALILARGEAFVWRVAERLTLRRRPTAVQFMPAASRVRLIPVASTRSCHDVRLAYSRALRGPPVSRI